MHQFDISQAQITTTNANMICISGSARQMNKQVEFKQHYFESLHSLKHDQQKSLLTRFIVKEITIWEMMLEAKGMKSLNTLKDMFLR